MTYAKLISKSILVLGKAPSFKGPRSYKVGKPTNMRKIENVGQACQENITSDIRTANKFVRGVFSLIMGESDKERST